MSAYQRAWPCAAVATELETSPVIPSDRAVSVVLSDAASAAKPRPATATSASGSSQMKSRYASAPAMISPPASRRGRPSRMRRRRRRAARVLPAPARRAGSPGPAPRRCEPSPRRVAWVQPGRAGGRGRRLLRMALVCGMHVPGAREDPTPPMSGVPTSARVRSGSRSGRLAAGKPRCQKPRYACPAMPSGSSITLTIAARPRRAHARAPARARRASRRAPHDRRTLRRGGRSGSARDGSRPRRRVSTCRPAGRGSRPTRRRSRRRAPPGRRSGRACRSRGR